MGKKRQGIAGKPSKAGGLLSQKMHNPTFPKKHKSLSGHGGQPEEGYKPSNFYVDERLYIPTSDEMKGKLRQAESSLCKKIINLSVGELTEFMVGAEAYRKIMNTMFLSTMLDYVRDFKALFTEKIDYVEGLTHFPTYSPHADLESQKLIQGTVLSFLRTVNKNLLPLWLVPHEKGERNHVLECMAKALTNWPEGQKLVSKYADVPFAKGTLAKLSRQLGFPPNEIGDLVHGIGTNLMNFVGLLYVHVFRLFVVKAIDANGVVCFYTLETWQAVKEKKAAKGDASAGPSGDAAAAKNGNNSVEKEVSKKKRRSAAVEEEEAEPEKQKKKRKRTSDAEREDSPFAKKVKREKKDDVNLITLSDDEEPAPPPVFDMGKVKNEFDSKKVKREKTNGLAAYGMDHMNMPLGAEASLRMETGSMSSTPGMPPPSLHGLPPPVAAPPVNQFPDLDRVLSDAERDPSLSSNWRNSLWMMSCRIRDLSGIKDNLQTMARNQETMIMQREQKIAEQDNTIRVLRQMLEFHNIRPPAFM